MNKDDIYETIAIWIYYIIDRVKKLINWFKRKIKEVLVILGIITIASISILNIHSHPQAGDMWAVSFETTGLRDLIITPDDQNTIDDLDFISLKCGEEERTPQILENDVIFYPNWFCTKEGQIIHIVNIARDHYLKFQFGNETKYAYNSPDFVLDQSNTDGSFVAVLGIRHSSSQTHNAQSFTPSVTADIGKIVVRFSKLGTIPSGKVVNAAIWSDSGDEPNAQIVAANNSIQTDDVPAHSNTDEFTFTFTAGTELTNGTKYWIVLTADYAVSGANKIYFWGENVGSGGTMTYGDGSNWNVLAAWDAYFEEYYIVVVAKRTIQTQFIE